MKYPPSTRCKSQQTWAWRSRIWKNHHLRWRLAWMHSICSPERGCEKKILQRICNMLTSIEFMIQTLEPSSKPSMKSIPSRSEMKNRCRLRPRTRMQRRKQDIKMMRKMRISPGKRESPSSTAGLKKSAHWRWCWFLKWKQSIFWWATGMKAFLLKIMCRIWWLWQRRSTTSTNSRQFIQSQNKTKIKSWKWVLSIQWLKYHIHIYKRHQPLELESTMWAARMRILKTSTITKSKRKFWKSIMMRFWNKTKFGFG